MRQFWMEGGDQGGPANPPSCSPAQLAGRRAMLQLLLPLQRVWCNDPGDCGDRSLQTMAVSACGGWVTRKSLPEFTHDFNGHKVMMYCKHSTEVSAWVCGVWYLGRHQD